MWKAQDHIVWRKKQDLLLVLDTDSGHYYTLNPSAVQLWTYLIEENHSWDDSINRIMDSFSELPGRDQVDADCKKMLEDWMSNNLVIKD